MTAAGSMRARRGAAGRHRTPATRATISDLSCALLCAVGALAPLPFGSNDPVSLGVWCLVLAIGLVAASPGGLGGRRTAMLLGLAGLGIAEVIVLQQQMSVGGWPAGPDPVWARAAAVLDQPLGASASQVARQPCFAPGNMLAGLGAAALGLIVGADARNARRLLATIAWSGLCYTVYGVVSALIEPTMILWLERPGYVGNAIGTFINRNTAATYFGCCATLWLLLLAEAVREDVPAGTLTWARLTRGALHRPTRRIAIRFGGTFACLAALLLTGSRAGIVISLAAMAACVCVMFWRDLPRRVTRTRLVLIAAAGGLVALQALGGSLSRRFEESGLGDADRFDVYGATFRMIADHPWLGTGAGTFAWAFPAYRGVPPSLFGVWTMGHSTPLETAAELGLPFTILLAAAVGVAFAVLVGGVRARRRDRIVPLAGAATLGIAVVHSCIDFSLQIPGLAIVVMILLGIGLAQSEATSVTVSPRRRAGHPARDARPRA